MDSRTKRPRHETQPFAFYTRYPEGIAGSLAEDLLCPECGAEEIVILKETADGMLGDLAQCWNCKHEFTITDNCWKPREKPAWTNG
jgi:hypothetical protein